ncbi:hypothetical protein EDD22DRAFT_844465 [Suillus occidentalis]|nr:hypothetical protein EDD22DRAFT_844465 [Suillus occidentalis]
MDQPGAYFGFYHTNGTPVLDSPMEFIHTFLKSYYTGGSLAYLDVVYDIGTDEKLDPYRNQVRKMIRGLKNSFAWERVVIGVSTHTDEDYRDPFIGYEDTKEYHSTGVNDFLEIILQPWQGIIDHAQESYLWMLCCGSLVNNKDSFHGLQEAVVHHKFTGTIAFSAPHFQPSFALHLLLSFTEQVLIGRCPLHLVFKDMLAQACDLGCHSDIFLLTTDKEGALTCSRSVLGVTTCLSNAVVVVGLILGGPPMSKVARTSLTFLSAKMTLAMTGYTFCKLVLAYILKEFLHIMADWTLVFKAILDEHKIAYVSAKGNAIKRATILKSIKDTIDHEDGSDEDDEKGPDLMVQVNDEGYPCLSTGFESLILKNQQKVVWQVFQKSYALITNHPQAAVPWGHITQDPDHYLDMDCIPRNVVIKDPSHLQKEAISMIYSLWKSRANHNKPIVQFVGYKEGDFYDSLAKRADVSQKSRKSRNFVEVTSDEDQVLKKAAQADLSSDKEEDLAMHHNYTPSLSNSCPKFHMNGDLLLATVQKLSNTQTLDTKGKARKQHLPVWVSWTWSEAYLPQNIHNDVQSSSVALEELENYIIKSCGWGMIVVLGLGLLLRECCRAQEYEVDEAGDDVPQYLGDSILGIQVGEKIEEAITRIQEKFDAMLPDGNEKLMTVSEEVHMRYLENKRQVKERREAEWARVVEEKKVAEEARVAEEERVAEKKRLAEMSRMAEEKRLAEEKRVAESPQRVKKTSNTNTGGKGKGKRPATDLNDSAMKKVKTSAPPDAPCHSA